MNIGVIVDNEFNNDPRVSKEVNLLLEQGYKVHVLCFAYDGKTYKERPGLIVKRIPIKERKKDILNAILNSYPAYEWLWTKHIKAFIEAYQLQVVHCHDLYMSRATYKAVQISSFKPKMILDLHENYPAAILSYNWSKGLRRFLVRPKRWQKKEKAYLSYPDYIIALSEHYKKDLLEKYPFLKAEQIISYPNIIDFKKFEEYPIDSEFERSPEFTLMYFGRVAERRGIFEAIAAVKEVIRSGTIVKLIFIGPIDKADRQRFMQDIKEEIVRPYIQYIPWIDVSLLPTYLANVEVGLAPFHVNPQHESGIANKIFQYMYGKTPLIASNCRPQQEVIEEAQCGLIFSTQEEFVQHIQYLAQNPEKAKEMGENGYKKLIDKYLTQDQSQKLLDIYKAIG